MSRYYFAPLWLASIVAVLGACGSQQDQEPYRLKLDQSVLASTVDAFAVDGLKAHWSSYNPSIARLGGQRFMAFRIDSPLGLDRFQSEIALVAIDAQYRQLGPFTVLQTPHAKDERLSAEDPRLFVHEGALYVIYNAKPVARAKRKQRRMFLGRIELRGDALPQGQIAWVRQLDVAHEWLRQRRWEKNWTPFSHDGAVHLIYRANPPLVLRIAPERLDDIEMALGQTPVRASLHEVLEAEQQPLEADVLPVPGCPKGLPEPVGIWRGGSQALFAPELGEYVTFFHTRGHVSFDNGQSSGRHYLVGFYAFAATPPFAITRYVEEPLQLPEDAGLPAGTTRIVFPGGVVDEGDHFVVSFGHEDRAIRTAVFDKQHLFARLRPVGEEGVAEQTLQQPAARGTENEDDAI